MKVGRYKGVSNKGASKPVRLEPELQRIANQRAEEAERKAIIRRDGVEIPPVEPLPKVPLKTVMNMHRAGTINSNKERHMRVNWEGILIWAAGVAMASYLVYQYLPELPR